MAHSGKQLHCIYEQRDMEGNNMFEGNQDDEDETLIIVRYLDPSSNETEWLQHAVVIYNNIKALSIWKVIKPHGIAIGLTIILNRFFCRKVKTTQYQNTSKQVPSPMLQKEKSFGKSYAWTAQAIPKGYVQKVRCTFAVRFVILEQSICIEIINKYTFDTVPIAGNRLYG